MEKTREITMEALEEYAGLLHDCGHLMTINTKTGNEMKELRIKEAEFIFNQCKKGGTIPKEAKFDRRVVNLSDINDTRRYYAGTLCILSVSSHVPTYGRITTTADAAHCQGLGPQSYGTILQAAVYDTKNYIFPLVFAHSVRTECEEAWLPVFKALKELPAFDVERRTTIVDQEKSIDLAFRSIMSHASLFFNWMHVKKKCQLQLVQKKLLECPNTGVRCERHRHKKVAELKRQFGPKLEDYLSQFKDNELYISHSKLEDTVHSSQGTESLMCASLFNNVRNVEPQKIVHNFISKERSNLLKRKEAALNCSSPVSPHVERRLAKLIQKARVYQQSVQFVDGTNMMEATVASYSDLTQRRRVVLSPHTHTAPSCCSFSKKADGFPCYHGAAVICEKYGTINIHRFIPERHLTAAWKKQYDGVDFALRTEGDIEKAFSEARAMVDSGAI